MISMRIGLSPARYMEEYLAVLHPLFSEGRVDFAGQVFSVKAERRVQDSSPLVPLFSSNSSGLRHTHRSYRFSNKIYLENDFQNHI
jgi:alkanesulfonate monooxygenase SsuD/methylene tetrahydromethanopterin reductase-like flavin-dependent oxidoreductase (luciferase family)